MKVQCNPLDMSDEFLHQAKHPEQKELVLAQVESFAEVWNPLVDTEKGCQQ